MGQIEYFTHSGLDELAYGSMFVFLVIRQIKGANFNLLVFTLDVLVDKKKRQWGVTDIVQEFVTSTKTSTASSSATLRGKRLPNLVSQGGKSTTKVAFWWMVSILVVILLYLLALSLRLCGRERRMYQHKSTPTLRSNPGNILRFAGE